MRGRRSRWREWEMKDQPPNDDVCPVCFGDFTLPCRTSCGHWFCGSCILQVWNHGSAFQPCKCPMCCSHIKSLTPLASPNHYSEEEAEAEATLKTLEKYNHLFVGGIRGMVLKLRETPLLAKRVFREMTDPDQAFSQFIKWRLFSMILGLLYMICPFNFIPPGVNIIHVCNCFGVLMVGFLKLHGLYTRIRSAQRIMQMAARPGV